MTGKPHREILRAAVENQAELIVMGVQGRGAITVRLDDAACHPSGRFTGAHRAGKGRMRPSKDLASTRRVPQRGRLCPSRELEYPCV